MSENEIVIDDSGVEYGTGLWTPPADAVCAAPYIEDMLPNNVLEDADIRKLITDQDRRPRRAIFDDHWVAEGNQKQKSSCNGWAGASVLSKTRWLSGIRDGLVLSGSYVYSWINNGQDNGSALDRGMAELMAHGAPSAASCPWDQIYRNQTSKYDNEAAKHKGLACYAAKTKQGFRSGIALGFLGVVAVQVDRTQFVNFKGTGILKAFHGPGNHAIHVDDMTILNGTEVYDAVNNWGVSWGNRGRAYLTWDSFAETFSVHEFYLIGSNLEGT